MRAPCPYFLPPSCRAMRATITSYVHVLDFLAITTIAQVSHDVEIGESCSHVVGVVDPIFRKVAGSSPVGGNGGQMLYSP